LADELQPLLAAHRGQVAVAIKHLETGESYSYRGDVPMPTASLIKFPVMAEAYRQAADGRIDLDEMVTLTEEDRVPGSGVLTEHFSAGARLSLRDVIRLMIAFSDNTATNLVLDRIGIGATADWMEQRGMPHTKIHAKVFRRDTSLYPARSQQFGLGSTTANETVRLYEELHRKTLVSPEACEQMLAHLYACQDDTKLVSLLPAGTRVAHKSGTVARVRCDAGILFSPRGPIAVCVLTSENEDQSWERDNAAHRLCGRVARAAYDYFNPPSAVTGEPFPEVLREGDNGELVEILQRTLNARMKPSPELTVDGVFGPMTRAAVVRFQRDRGLTAEGEVGTETWHALGPLETADSQAPDPESINTERLARQPRDPLSGPPFVTCKAWAIADRRSGELLWSHNADQPLDFASTTKIMTALIILELAEREPGVLDEELVFSRRADETTGSSARVMAGERLPVREALYGLLLPSGNDAAVALAEHFGGRFEPPGEAGSTDAEDPLLRFVTEMNRAAGRLGMSQTVYRNPHGLTAQDHRASARDLVRLAHAAWRIDRFRTYVGTRQHGWTVTGPGGYRRHVVWRNTNQLLPIEGYEGIKTGTTTAAGACLISASRRDDDELLMVVLGAESSSARYVDSRNLYRWAWHQLGHQD
jgi:D-alanyl-D-alanine carboxypeptidase (penicillin-binding protein 5/6)